MGRAAKAKTDGHGILLLRHDFLELDEVKITILSDLHVGHPYCNEELITKTVEQVAKEDRHFLILNGDLIECVTRTSPGDIYHLKYPSPDEQVEVLVDTLNPVKDRILGIVSGNHELRGDGHDYGREIARILGIAHLHSRDAILHEVRVGKRKNLKPWAYTIFQTHGRGSAATPGGKTNTLHRYGAIVPADIVLVGHLHTAKVETDTTIEFDPRNLTTHERRRYLIMLSSALGYSEYALRMGMKPSGFHVVELTLSGREHAIEVALR